MPGHTGSGTTSTTPGWTAAARKGALKELNCWSYQQMLRRYSASARRT